MSRKSGIGLANVRSRLQARFQEQARLDTTSKGNCWTSEVILPCPTHANGNGNGNGNGHHPEVELTAQQHLERVRGRYPLEYDVLIPGQEPGAPALPPTPPPGGP